MLLFSEISGAIVLVLKNLRSLFDPFLKELKKVAIDMLVPVHCVLLFKILVSEPRSKK